MMRSSLSHEFRLEPSHMSINRYALAFTTSVSLMAFASAHAQAQAVTQKQATEALHTALQFYSTQVGFEGVYLWKYAADLTAQEGEEKASRTSGWTQPPGTPAVGEALLRAWQLTDDLQCKDAAVETAIALVRAQLESGGWSSEFELHPDQRKRYRYRVDRDQSSRRNSTTFDDDKSQSAMMLLMHVDEQLRFSNSQIHEAVE